MLSQKKWSIAFLVLVIMLLAGLGSVTAVVDPYFHYHGPLKSLEYPINNERYQNDGIVKHFDYDAVITGMSTAENFKTSEFDELFGTHSVKVCYSGGSYREINDNLRRAVEANPDIRYVLRGLDAGRLFEEKDTLSYDGLPIYLYDRKLYNDVYYLLNKEILFQSVQDVLDYTDSGKTTTDFDSYSNWAKGYEFGREPVLAAYERPAVTMDPKRMSDEDYEKLCGNITQNVAAAARENPDITFYFYFSPHSIYYWDQLNQFGVLEMQIEAQQIATEILLECDNVFVFSFFDEYDMICDPENYKDTLHFSEEINSRILHWVYQKDHLLTRDNYKQYYEKIRQFYVNYDYESLFAD